MQEKEVSFCCVDLYKPAHSQKYKINALKAIQYNTDKIH